jgi:hypothetical protein
MDLLTISKNVAERVEPALDRKGGTNGRVDR